MRIRHNNEPVAQRNRRAPAVLFQVDAGDPLIFVTIVIVLLIAGVVACIVPAIRATHVDPIVALRAE